MCEVAGPMHKLIRDIAAAIRKMPAERRAQLRREWVESAKRRRDNMADKKLIPPFEAALAVALAAKKNGVIVTYNGVEIKYHTDTKPEPAKVQETSDKAKVN
jgi:hypothetical protein